MADSVSAVSVSNLTKTYGKVVAVAAVDMKVDAGEVFGLLGPNGAEKTTLVKILVGLARPDSGSAAVFGATGRKPGRQRGVGIPAGAV